MRLAVALLLAAVAAVPAAAQQANPSQSKPSPSKPAHSKQSQPSHAKPAAQSAPAAAQPAPAPAKLTPEEERLRQRILLKERFNKGWDIQAETPRERKARCRAEARNRYSALHPLKRRKYQKNCNAEERH